MIIIFSNQNDLSTAIVIQWLIKENHSFIRINEEDNVSISKININDGDEGYQLKYKDVMINFSDITSVWYRRGSLSFIEENIEFEESIQKDYVQKDFSIVREFVFRKLGEKRSINNYNSRSVNKLIALDIAKQCGLRIPDTLVTSDKNELQLFLRKHKNIITKAISESPIDLSSHSFFYTEKVSEKLFNDLPQTFFTSLFQECLDKTLEIRTFYLHEKLYSMAIFSQSDKQTSVDFRRYKTASPNRNVPFKLPRNIKRDVIRFMKSMGLNCGSLDFVYTKDKKFVFLEVNPIGQFGMVSFPCNYNLEKVISSYLAN